MIGCPVRGREGRPDEAMMMVSAGETTGSGVGITTESDAPKSKIVDSYYLDEESKY